MKTSLTHLPPEKQHELSIIVSSIQEKYTVEMIILFGSYARGKWVEELHDDGFHYKYQSDFDIFIVTEKGHLANKIESDDQLWNCFNRRIKTPATVIAHDIEFLNRRLRKGQYFFSDVKKEGICLYNSGHFELADEKELSSKEYKHSAEEDFNYWFNSAKDFYDIFCFCFANKNYSKAAFLLHQATENFYNTLLLVLTRYKPNTHDLKKLGKRVASIEPIFLKIFPQGTEEERNHFELLRKAYVSARYNKNYKITPEELTWLSNRVGVLQDMTEEICKKKIEGFDNQIDTKS
jgi:predicted nucleotidyltransferase/HEPN domain-containing protein